MYDELDITFVRAGKGFYIYGNHHTQQYYGSGMNETGQLGLGNATWFDEPTQIDYFKKNQIIIQQIFTNRDSSCAF